VLISIGCKVDDVLHIQTDGSGWCLNSWCREMADKTTVYITTSVQCYITRWWLEKLYFAGASAMSLCRCAMVTADALFSLSSYSTFPQTSAMDLRLLHNVKNGLNSHSNNLLKYMTPIAKLQPFENSTFHPCHASHCGSSDSKPIVLTQGRGINRINNTSGTCGCHSHICDPQPAGWSADCEYSIRR